MRLTNPADAVYFDVGLSYPAEPHECTPDRRHAVITGLDMERGVMTISSAPGACAWQWPLRECER